MRIIRDHEEATSSLTRGAAYYLVMAGLLTLLAIHVLGITDALM